MKVSFAWAVLCPVAHLAVSEDVKAGYYRPRHLVACSYCQVRPPDPPLLVPPLSWFIFPLHSDFADVLTRFLLVFLASSMLLSLFTTRNTAYHDFLHICAYNSLLISTWDRNRLTFIKRKTSGFNKLNDVPSERLMSTFHLLVHEIVFL